MSWRDLRVVEKSTAVGLRRAKQGETTQTIFTTGPGHHSLRCLGGGDWALRLRLWRAVLKLLTSSWWTRPVGGRSKPLQLSLTPEVVWPTTAGDI